MSGPQELLVIMLFIALFSLTGLWPHIIRGIRELRGERLGEEPANGADVELSYKMLGVSPSAQWEEIERAYRTKAKIHHPDRGGDDDAMRALNDAYNLLKQIRKR